MKASAWPIRKWFLDNESHPWPTKAELDVLVVSSGRTRKQVIKYMSSLRRGKNPHSMRNGRGTYVLMEWFRHNPHHPYPDAKQVESLASESGLSFKAVSSRLQTLRYKVKPPAIDPYSSEKLQHSTAEGLRFPLTSQNDVNKKGKRRWPRISDTSRLNNGPVHSERTAEKIRRPYECTVCSASFKTYNHWKVHETEVHRYNATEWICMPDGLQEVGSTCDFCSEPVKDAGHLEQHRASKCAARPRHKRTFLTKRQFVGHLRWWHFRGASDERNATVTVPPTWERPVDCISPHALWCGFCQIELESVKARMEHVGQHFKAGKTTEEWVHRPSRKERNKP